MKERLYLFDTTLRDGAQTAGIEFSLEDKIQVAGCSTSSASTMSRAAIPAPTPPTTAFFEAKRTERATFTAFGMTKRPGVSLGNDPGVQRPHQCEVGCDLLRRQDLGPSGPASRSRSPTRRTSSTCASPSRPRRAAGQGSAPRLRALLRRLQGQPRLRARLREDGLDAGARWVVLCDTNGGTHAGGGRGDRRRGDEDRSRRPPRHPRP